MDTWSCPMGVQIRRLLLSVGFNWSIIPSILYILTVLYTTYYYKSVAQQFVFRVLPLDVLEIEVRDKFSVIRPSVSHFLGKVKIPLASFLQEPGVW